MRKIAEKVAIIAQICITLVFVVTTLLSVTNVIPWNDNNNNGVLVTMLIIMAVIYGLLSAYLIYVNFSEKENIRQILLFCDSESATHANVKVIRNIVRSCARRVDGVRVKRAKMRVDEKHGLVATFKTEVSTNNVSESIDKLRCLVADAFKNTLGLTFNSINFEISKLKTNYQPDEEKAEKLAKTLTQQRELSADIYASPTQQVDGVCTDELDGDMPRESQQNHTANDTPVERKENERENETHTDSESETATKPSSKKK